MFVFKREHILLSLLFSQMPVSTLALDTIWWWRIVNLCRALPGREPSPPVTAMEGTILESHSVCPWGEHSSACIWLKPWKSRATHLVICSSIFDAQQIWKNKWISCEPISFGVICYSEISIPYGRKRFWLSVLFSLKPYVIFLFLAMGGTRAVPTAPHLNFISEEMKTQTS